MANSYTLLADLRAGRCSNTAEVRLLRFWEARNTKKGGELMSVDMLFVDEQSTLIHGTVNASRSQTYRQDFNEGSIYSLSGFDVTRSNNNFRLSDAPVSVRFGEGTRFTRVTDSDKVIPTEMFRFRSYDQLLALANTNRQLPDILGELTAIRSTISDGLHGSQRVMLTLCVERGLSVCVSLFDGLAYAFHEKMTSYGAEPKVAGCSLMGPLLHMSTLTLRQMLQVHSMPNGLIQTGTSSKLLHAQKIEPITVSELNQYVLTADPQGFSLRVEVDLFFLSSSSPGCDSSLFFRSGGALFKHRRGPSSPVLGGSKHQERRRADECRHALSG
ncbi:hypothetical protein DY000_02048517 [Brassica cretica]|uniref:Replication protein A 70 kDa DNA-binding subunit B/D first OB fold domain-containing protein n=1 Tax=Brassica cretica TaxID=69181 RepID=A0ABQ7ER27_BRACR|nr:hypothetical protein DY000_02048517 [Brassica cretica]